MSIVETLTTLGLHPMARSARAAAAKNGEDAEQATARFLGEQLRRCGPGLGAALTASAAAAWTALDMAVSGAPFWSRLETVLDASDQALVRPARDFLVQLPGERLPAVRADYRRKCVRELRRLLGGGLLTEGQVSLDQLVEATVRLDEQKAVSGLAGELVHAGCPNLVELLTAGSGPPLLVLAMRQFLDQTVRDDPVLSAQLTWHAPQPPSPGFAGLRRLLTDHAETVNALLDESLSAGEKGHAKSLDLYEEFLTQPEEHRPVYRDAWAAQRRHGLLRTTPRPRDGVAVSDAKEREQLRTVIGRCRAGLSQTAPGRPALLNAVGKLEMAGGDFTAAEQDFLAVAGLATDVAAQAEAFANAYRAALGRRDWDAAHRHLIQALKLGGKRLAPLPVGPLVPQRILTADERGVVFLCRRKADDATVVARAVDPDQFGRGVASLFADLQRLQSVTAPGLLRIHEFGFVDPENRGRPYVVTEHFAGETLEAVVRARGPFRAEDVASIATQLAQGLAAAEKEAVWHRDLKPASVLVQRHPTATGWEVRLSDFGLGTAPDIHGFGKLCCFALFRSTTATPEQWRAVPQPLAGVLRQCLADSPGQRPDTFEAIVRALRHPAPTAVTESPPAPVREPVREPAPDREAAPRRKREPRPKRIVERQAGGLQRPLLGLPLWGWLAGGSLVAVAVVVLLLVVGIQLLRGPHLFAGTNEHAGKELPPWGLVVDPDKDCRLTPGNKSLTITVPGTLHDLFFDPGPTNAPRVMREVEGDFVMTVKVAGDFRPVSPSTNPRTVPYHGGGILVWVDHGNSLRFERYSYQRGGPFNTGVSFMAREGGRPTATIEDSFPVGDCYVRLERQGGRFTGSVSGDGRHWRQLRPVETRWPAKVSVGVTAISTSSQPFSVTFEDYSLEARGGR